MVGAIDHIEVGSLLVSHLGDEQVRRLRFATAEVARSSRLHYTVAIWAVDAYFNALLYTVPRRTNSHLEDSAASEVFDRMILTAEGVKVIELLDKGHCRDTCKLNRQLKHQCLRTHRRLQNPTTLI